MTCAKGRQEVAEQQMLGRDRRKVNERSPAVSLGEFAHRAAAGIFNRCVGYRRGPELLPLQGVRLDQLYSFTRITLSPAKVTKTVFVGGEP